MQIGLRQFSSETVEWFKAACQDRGPKRLSRSALARELCMREEWLDSHGKPLRASAQKILPKLALSLGISLPEPRKALLGSHRRPETGYPDKPLACCLAALGDVSLEMVAEDSRLSWESMVESHHPLGWRRAPGAQMRYWILSSRHGFLGGVGFSAGGCQLAPRDRFIGWSAEARLANIGLVACNQRFLILPSVHVRGLASRSLRLAAERVAGDWEAKYGVRPALAYSFTGPDHSGLSYRAAGWIRCDEESSGRRSGERRSVWMKPLEEGWRDRLCREPRRTLGHAPPLWSEGSWEDREYARSSHSDGRIRRRIAATGKAWLERPGESLPSIFPVRAEHKAVNRLLSSDNVTMEHILDSHCEATVDRCRLERLVLVIQAAATLNFHWLKSTSSLDDGKGDDGIPVHFSAAINDAGRPLGLIGIDASFRGAEGKDGVRWVKRLDRASEMSAACPNTRVVTVCDREGDYWPLLARAKKTGAPLVIGSSRSAQRRIALPGGKTADLWTYIENAPSLGAQKVKVPERDESRRRNERTAPLTFSFAAVDLIPPKKMGGENIRVTAVSAKEESPSETSKTAGHALHWRLLTTQGEPGKETAAEAIRMYELRWQIEHFFHALKSGTGIEARRFRKIDPLKKCLVFDAISAYRVWDLMPLASEKPVAPERPHFAQDYSAVL